MVIDVCSLVDFFFSLKREFYPVKEEMWLPKAMKVVEGI